MNDINKIINQSYTSDHGCENGSVEINNLIIQKNLSIQPFCKER